MVVLFLVARLCASEQSCYSGLVLNSGRPSTLFLDDFGERETGVRGARVKAKGKHGAGFGF